MAGTRRAWWAAILFVGLLPGAVLASELRVYTFYQERPFKGLSVTLDGRVVGVSDAQGEVRTRINEGAHQIQVLRDDAVLGEVDLILAADESAEVSLAFTDFDSPPRAAVATFDTEGGGADVTGELRGQVVNADGLPVAGAQIAADDIAATTTSSASGTFALTLPRGLQTLTISHPDYATTSTNPIRVVANIGVATSITLRRPAASDAAQGLSADDFSNVEEVEVVGTFNPTENTADLERFSMAITDSISIDDLLRFGDSDVAAALKRIVGVAVTGGKYANIRGLDGRYISSTLNGSLMPSTDPFRRDVQLDLFPSEILGGIEIQKSYSADLPGDTTGGIISMTSREIPTEDEAGISVSLEYVDGVTGEDLLSYRGSGGDALGMDDGLRELPGDIRSNLSNGNFRFRVCQFEGQTNCVAQPEAARLAGLLPVIYNPRRESAGPNFGLSGKYGRRLERETGELGYYGTLTYGQSHGSRQDARYDTLDAVGDVVWDSFQVGLNAYGVVGWVDEDGWQVTSKTILLRDSEDRTTVEDGFNKDDDVDEVLTVLEWVERQFIGQQFESVTPLFAGHELTVRAGFTQTERLSPDRREYQYRNNVFIAPTLERSYSELTEDSLDLGADYSLPLSLSSSLYTNLRFGVLINSRDRDNELIRLGVLNRPNNTLDPSLDLETLLVAENFENDFYRLATNRTTETDTYVASQDVTALYAAAETDLGTAWSLITGLRLEQYSIDLDYPNQSGAGSSSVSDQDSDDVLPALGLVYRGSDAWQLRAGFSQTVSRPNITELADSRFFDQEGREFIGCPSCTDSDITNLDLRGEYYFGANQSVSLAVFFKDIDRPLERAVADGSGSALSALTFRNSTAGTVQGVELDGSWRAWDGIDHVLNVSGNIALIESDIELDEDGQRLEGLSSRELQGQSPFLANLQLAYDNYPFDATLTFVLNYFDDRIDAVSRAPTDFILESGRIDLNLNAEKTFRGGSKLSLKLRNVLDEPIERTQSGRVIETYKRGVSLSLGYSLSF